MRQDSSAEDLGRRPRIETATILPSQIMDPLEPVDSEGTDVETLINTYPGEVQLEPRLSVVPIQVTDDDLIPLEDDDDDDDQLTTRGVSEQVELEWTESDPLELEAGTAEDDDWTVRGEDTPFDEPSEDATTRGATPLPSDDALSDDTEASVVVSGAKPGGYDLLRTLRSPATGELFVAEKPMYFGIPRRAYLRRLSRTANGFDQQRRKMLAEARVGAAFHHPSLVAVTHAGEDDQGVHVAYEHVDGTNLARVNRLLRDRGEAMPFEIVAWIVADALRGLHHAHQLADDKGRPKRLVVGSLCPEHVLVSRTGQTKLATFALTLARSGDAEAACRLAAEAGPYVAPEIAIRSEWSIGSDVYAIGVLLFELLAGRPSFPETSFDAVPIGVLREEEVPPGLIEIVERAVHHRPEQRFADAMAMASALNAWIHDSGRHAMPSLVSRFFEKHDLFEEEADGAFGSLQTNEVEVERGPSRAERPRVAELFGTDTQEDIALDSEIPEDTLSAMIIREDIDPESIERDVESMLPVDSVIQPVREPEPVPDTMAPPTQPGNVEMVSAVHRIRRGPRPLTVGLIIGAALLCGVLISLAVSLAGRDAPAPALVGEQVQTQDAP